MTNEFDDVGLIPECWVKGSCNNFFASSFARTWLSSVNNVTSPMESRAITSVKQKATRLMGKELNSTAKLAQWPAEQENNFGHEGSVLDGQKYALHGCILVFQT